MNFKKLSVVLVLLLSGFSGANFTANNPLVLLIIGDSLTEGYGISSENAYPSLLENKFKQKGMFVKVVNGGTSGSTSASGLEKLRWYTRSQPDAVFLTLGSNDGLRGVPLEALKKNLIAMIEYCHKKGWWVALAGLQVPPSHGKVYAQKYRQLFPDLAKQYQLPFFPFLLEGVAGENKFNLPDGIHPNEKGHQIIAQNVFLFLHPSFKKKLGLKSTPKAF